MEEYTFQVANKEYKILAESEYDAMDQMNINVMPGLNLGSHTWFGNISNSRTWRAGLRDHSGSFYD